jgi:hypothetical protein
MSIDDHVDNELEDRKIFLQELIDNNHLDGTALGITKQVIAEGEDGLSPEQKRVFERYVLWKFVTKECQNGCVIPWSEQYKALHSAAYGRNQRRLPRCGPDLTCGDRISNLTSR